MIFFTGGTGFIGAHFLYHLMKKGEEVIALHRKNSDLEYVKNIFKYYESESLSLFDKIRWIEGDVTDYPFLVQNISHVDAIFHLAAMVSFNPKDYYRLMEINTKGTENIVNLAIEKDIPHLVYLSSVGALDPGKKGEKITEDDFGNNPKRMSKYAESKFKSELEVWRGIEEGLKAVIVNPSIVLGPGVPEEGAAKIFQKIRKGLKYYPEGITGFIDVRDVCKATLDLYYRGILNDRFILSEGNHSYKEIFELIAENYELRAPDKLLNPRLTGFAWRAERIRQKLFRGNPVITREMHNSMHNQVYFSNNKIREKLGYDFIPIAKTIEDTVSFLS